MKQSTTIHFLLIIFFALSSSQLLAMEDQTNSNLVNFILMGWTLAQQESILIVSQFNDFVALNDSLLSEASLSQSRKESAQSTKEEATKLIKIIEEDQSNLLIYQKFHPTYKCIKQFVNDLELHSSQEPILKNHLESYYALLRNLTVIDNRVNLIKKDMKKLIHI